MLRRSCANPLSVALACVVCLGGCGSGAPSSPKTLVPVPRRPLASVYYGVSFQRRTLYHSPQTPGFTSWVGAWMMPDRSMIVAFDQATGPVDPNQRQLLPAATLKHAFGLTERAAASPSSAYLDPHRDFWGLDQSIVYLRSTDGGQTWRRWRTDPFRAIASQPYTPQADIALPDGTLLRRVNGDDLRNFPAVPHTAFLETLHFDPANSSLHDAHWSQPEVVLHDRRICKYQISRIHQLSDGRLIALGNAWHYAAGDSRMCAQNGYSDLLLVAASARAAAHNRWRLGMPFTTQIVPDEWDAAELPNGNLLAVLRTEVNGQPARREAILQRRARGWTMRTPLALPDLPAFQPSGHPDLLVTRLGVILSFADTGVAYTTNGGTSWQTLSFPQEPQLAYQTRYYPHAIQGANGAIYVFSHNGYDIPYGAFDESIVMDEFELRAGGAQALAPSLARSAAPATPPVAVYNAALTGVGGRAAALSFTLAAAAEAPAITAVKIGLPPGLGLSSTPRDVLQGVSLATANGGHVDFRAALGQISEGRLLLELNTAARAVHVTISGGAIRIDESLAASVRTGHLRTIEVIVKVTTAGGAITRLPLSLPTT